MPSIRRFAILLFFLIFNHALNAGEVSSDKKHVLDALSLNKQEKEWIESHQTVTVAVKTGWMPIEFKLENESSRGISMDYLNEIALLTGIKFRLTSYSDSLDQSNVHLISAVSGSQEIERYYKVEPAYLSTSYAAYINGNSQSLAEFTTFSDLSKGRIAYFKSASLGKKLREIFPEAQLIQVDIADEAFEYLKQERIDAYIGNEIVIDYHINFHKLSFAKKISRTPFTVEIYMAVHEDYPILNSIISKAIKHIGVNNQPILDYWNPRNLLSNTQIKLIAILLILSIVFAVYWFVLNKKNIKKLKETNIKEIWRQAHYDYQTSIPNRLYFETRLIEEILESSVVNSSFSILYIDLDDFKDINDRSGHVAGDRILKEVASRLSNCVTQKNFLARLGGDEFAAIIRKDLDDDSNRLICEKILKAISSPFQIDENLFHLSCSIGIATYPQDTTDDIELLSFADQAMYQAKASGKNQYYYYRPELTQKNLEKISIIQDLKTAIQKDQFNLVYQPIVDSETLEVVKLEALIRWNHPKKGSISPEKFIGIAEDSGLINELGKWIFKQVIADLIYLKETYPDRLLLGINVSPVQFHKNECFEMFVNQLYAHCKHPPFSGMLN